MPRSFRICILFAGVVAIVLGLSEVTLAGSLTKRTKKRKKKAAITIVVLPGTITPVRQPLISNAVTASNGYNNPVAARASHVGIRVMKMPKPQSLPVLPTDPPADKPVPLTAIAGQLVISEFRLFGPAGDNDEFIEIANISGADHTVDASGTGTGYALAASDGIVRCTIPDGTVIRNKGHYLCVNSVGYSLSGYPAGNGTTATGDATYTLDIPSNTGIALFSTNIPSEFALATRLDAVGPNTEANTLYKEGTGYFPLLFRQFDYTFYRDNCGKGGSTTIFGPCPSGGNLVDTNNNVADFIVTDVEGFIEALHTGDVLPKIDAGLGQRVGAPGPENLSSPIERNAVFPVTLLDPCVGASVSPNRVRDLGVPGTTLNGTLEIRRTITNSTGANVTRLRFRIVDITTFRVVGSGVADIRALSSSDIDVTVDRPPCGNGTSDITVRGTTLEQPPSQEINGGGFNSSLSAATITLATPLPNGASIDVRFLLKVVQTGTFKFYINIEALP